MSAAASLQLKLRLIRHVDLVADLDFDGLDPAVGNQGVFDAGRHRDDIAGAHGALLAVDDGAAHAGHNRPDLIPVLVAVVGQAMAGVEQDTDCRGFGLDIQNREGAPTLFGKPGFALNLLNKRLDVAGAISSQPMQISGMLSWLTALVPRQVSSSMTLPIVVSLITSQKVFQVPTSFHCPA